jgi:Rod binding domain-containing protein
MKVPESRQAQSMQSSPPARREALAHLRQMSHALESVFLNQLFQAMRATLPKADAADGPAQELYTSLFDEKLSEASTANETRGLGEALYHQLVRRYDAQQTAAAPTSGTATPRKGS